MSYRHLLAALLAALLASGPALAQQSVSARSAELVCTAAAPDIDPRRSIFVTELDVVQSAISLEDVMGKLVADSPDPSLTPDLLWAQWWDTQNPAPGLGLGANCDDQLDAQGDPALNGFPIQCPRNEGSEVNVDPFTPDTPSFYEPLALVNRFDLAPTDGANCGEARVVFARHSGASNDRERNLVIFEAVLPNPNPGCGLQGCREIAEFWKGLSRISDPARRADALRRFYLEGFPQRGIAPVIKASHFGLGAGQIRTNQFMTGSETQRWQLREFKLARLCDSANACTLRFVPVTVKENPFGELFARDSGDPRALRFQRHYLTQVENLSKAEINAFFAEVPDRFNAGQSNAQGPENDYSSHFGANTTLRRALTQRLRQLQIRLRPEHLVRRSLALSCAGCHQLSNLAPANDLGEGMQWPQSLGFVHVSEQDTDLIDDSLHFRISPALEDVFIPHRHEVFRKYLGKVACRDCPSLSTSPTPSLLPAPTSLAVSSDATLAEISEEVRRVDAELKARGAVETLGGPRPGH